MLTTKEKHYIFGNMSEDNINNIFKKCDNILSVKQGDRYDKYDFIIITNKSIFVIELKTRLLQKNKYEYTFFQGDKLDDIQKLRNKLKAEYKDLKFFFICLIGFTINECQGINEITFDENNNIINMPDIEYYYIIYKKIQFKNYTKTLSYWRDNPQLTINIPITDINPLEELITKINKNYI